MLHTLEWPRWPNCLMIANIKRIPWNAVSCQSVHLHKTEMNLQLNISLEYQHKWQQ